MPEVNAWWGTGWALIRRVPDPPGTPVPEPWQFVASSTVDGGSSYKGFGGITRLSDDSLLVVTRFGASHLSGGNIVKYTGNATGSTWSGPTTILDSAKDLRDAEVTTLANGDLLISYTEHTESVTDYLVKVMRSTDDGATWGSPVTVSHGFTDWGFSSAKVVELGNGDLLLPIYGQNTGSAERYCRVSRSTDDGATWADLASITTPGLLSRNWNEPYICKLANDDLICGLRSEGATDAIFLSASTDDGATWGAPANKFLGGGRPAIHMTPDGTLTIVYRRNESVGQPGFRYSEDSGTTWSTPPYSFGTQLYFEYGSFVDLVNGDLGCLWAIENSTIDADAFFTEFAP